MSRASYKSPANDRGHPAWNQETLQRFKAGQTPERIAEDNKDLSRVFNLAARSTELKAALDWAQAHGVEIVIDRTSRNVGGYYMTGTGIVAIAANSLRHDTILAGVVAHEIRHAWQDYHGLIATAAYRLDHYIIKNALIEADATAHQQLAERQLQLFDSQQRQRTGQDNRPGAHPDDIYLMVEEKRLADPQAFMLGAFKGWYKSFRATLYGRAAAQRFGRKHGIPGARPPEWNLEVPMGNVIDKTGVDFKHLRRLRKLGEGYDGKNYLDRADIQALRAEQLKPARARQFFQSSKLSTDFALVNQVRRIEAKAQAKAGKRILLNPWG